MTEPIEPLLSFFVCEHLSNDLQPVGKLFADLAHTVVKTLPRNGERTELLRKLREARAAALRARMMG